MICAHRVVSCVSCVVCLAEIWTFWRNLASTTYCWSTNYKLSPLIQVFFPPKNVSSFSLKKTVRRNDQDLNRDLAGDLGLHGGSCAKWFMISGKYTMFFLLNILLIEGLLHFHLIRVVYGSLSHYLHLFTGFYTSQVVQARFLSSTVSLIIAVVCGLATTPSFPWLPAA